MKRQQILDIMNQILQRQGKAPATSEGTTLQALGFRSLDFSELALRVESASGKPLTFDARPMRAIRTVTDVLDFLERACSCR